MGYLYKKLQQLGIKKYTNVITKIATAQTWPSWVSDYQTKIISEQLNLLSHISLYTTVLFFLQSDQFQERKYKSVKEEKFKVQQRYRLQWRK